MNGGYTSTSMITNTTNNTTNNTTGGGDLLTELTVTGDNGINEDEDEVALRHSGSVVEGLQQMDLLSLVLELMEKVSGGSVTAKTVDNEVCWSMYVFSSFTD